MPGRKYNSDKYRYGFNGKEKDQSGEFGSITNYDYGFRIYNPAVGRFLSVDPLTSSYPELTPYQFASNTPIQAIDLDGMEAVTIHSAFWVDALLSVDLECLNSQEIIDKISEYNCHYNSEFGGYKDNESQTHAIKYYESAGEIFSIDDFDSPLRLTGYTNAQNGEVYKFTIYYTTLQDFVETENIDPDGAIRRFIENAIVDYVDPVADFTTTFGAILVTRGYIIFKEGPHEGGAIDPSNDLNLKAVRIKRNDNGEIVKIDQEIIDFDNLTEEEQKIRATELFANQTKSLLKVPIGKAVGVGEKATRFVFKKVVTKTVDKVESETKERNTTEKGN